MCGVRAGYGSELTACPVPNLARADAGEEKAARQEQRGKDGHMWSVRRWHQV